MRRLAALLSLLAVFSTACAAAKTEPAPAERAASTTTSTTEAPSTRYREQQFDDVDIAKDIVYGEAPGKDGAPEQLKLDLYTPRGDDETMRPLAIVVHGGGFFTGDKGQGVSPIMATHFAQLGYVAASLNYRLLAQGGCGGSNTGGSCGPAALEGIHDGQAAVRFLREHAEDYGIDPDRIAISGESAGGVIAYGAGVWSDNPGTSGTPGESSVVQAYMALSGGLPNGLFASEDDAPGIFFASTGDPIVPYQWTVDDSAALTKLGVVAEVIAYDLDVHVPFREERDDIIDRTSDFYYEHLGLEAIA